MITDEFWDSLRVSPLVKLVPNGTLEESKLSTGNSFSDYLFCKLNIGFEKKIFPCCQLLSTVLIWWLISFLLINSQWFNFWDCFFCTGVSEKLFDVKLLPQYTIDKDKRALGPTSLMLFLNFDPFWMLPPILLEYHKFEI